MVGTCRKNLPVLKGVLGEMTCAKFSIPQQIINDLFLQHVSFFSSFIQLPGFVFRAGEVRKVSPDHLD